MVNDRYKRGFAPILILILIFGIIAPGILFIGNAYKKLEEGKVVESPGISTPSATPRVNATQKTKSQSPSIPNPTTGLKKITPIPTSKPNNNTYPTPTPTTATYKSPTATPGAGDSNDHGRIFIGG